jgi:hypothetical protein
MDSSIRSWARPEAMGDVPGVCAVPLTRAVVQYRDVHETDDPRGHIEDIGLALVIDGRYAAASEALDLGSGRLKMLDLSTELVVLDWVYEPTHEHVVDLLARTSGADDAEVERYGFQLAIRVLERLGFGPLTRPVLLRIGYRDLCRDFDLHEGTSVRVVLGPGRVVRAQLDYDGCALLFRTAMHEPDAAFERALYEAFPEARLRRLQSPAPETSLQYRAQLALPTSFSEVQEVIASVRRGLARLTARFEPDRFATLSGLVETFGARETLGSLHLAEASRQPVPIGSTFAPSTVH